MTRAGFVRAGADARRLSLIEAGARVLAQSGAAGASVRAICAEAGVSPGLLRHYFAGIDDLIAAIYAHVCDTVGTALDTALSGAGMEPRDRLRAYVVASFRPPVADTALLATWLAFWSLVRTDPEIARIHGESYAGYRATIETLLGACGVAPQRQRLAAIAISALVDGLWLELTLDPSTFTVEEAETIAVRWVDRAIADHF